MAEETPRQPPRVLGAVGGDPLQSAESNFVISPQVGAYIGADRIDDSQFDQQQDSPRCVVTVANGKLDVTALVFDL